jgi:hypothetical protein
MLYVAFREDRSHIQSENGAQNFALIRRMALDALEREEHAKRKGCGMRTRQKSVAGIMHIALALSADVARGRARNEDLETSFDWLSGTR